MPKKKIKEENYLNNKAKLLKHDLMENFYHINSNKLKVYSIINHGKTENTDLKDHALRVYEWFCCNYSKKKSIKYFIDKNTEFNVFLSYKSCLDSYSKKQFDPFNRFYKGYSEFQVPVVLANGTTQKFTTTVAQLNFFRWCFVNKIPAHINKNKDDVIKDMKIISKEYTKPVIKTTSKTVKF